MDNKSGTIFIQDQDQKQSYEENMDPDLAPSEDDSNSNPHNIIDHDFQDLLQPEHETNEETVLRFKVTELQKICNSLTSTNRRLINKVTSLEEEKEKSKKSQIFVDEYSEMNIQFTEVQSLISEYKSSLDSFQKNVIADLKFKEETILTMEKQVQYLSSKNQEILLEKEDIQKLNKQLQTRNQGLIVEVENIQRQKNILEERLNNKSNYRDQMGYNRKAYDNSFIDDELSTEIQIQYEGLIDRLVQELEYERNIKKKMNEEIKRLSGELRNSQKQIMEKNRKLYEIQMKFLRSSKATTNESSIHKMRPTEHFQNRAVSKTQRNKDVRANGIFLNFQLLELINGELQQEILPEHRKVIGHKIIQFYERKLSKLDYSNVMPQNLLVANFTARRPELLIIKKTGTSAYEYGEKTEESLIWNMAFILDNLFGQVQQVEEFDQILEITGQMLEKQVANNRDSLESVKRLLLG